MISEQDYIYYINDSDPTWTCFAQLDHIPGKFKQKKTADQLAEAPQLSWKNYLYMVERVNNPEKLLPIFHQGEDFKYLIQMLEHSPRIDYIGISPANDLVTSFKDPWIARCFQIIQESSNPEVKTHGFGLTSFSILEKYPFYSADSTSWLQLPRYGVVNTKYGPIMISKKITHHASHIKYLPLTVSDELEEYFKGFGFTIEELGDQENRFKFSILYYKDWADNYQYTPKRVSQQKLF